MTKRPISSDDALVMMVRKALRETESRTLPTETRLNEYGYRNWVCPYCGLLVRRHDRSRWNRRQNRSETEPDYRSFNSHFGASHGTPFWREKHLITVIKRGLGDAR